MVRLELLECFGFYSKTVDEAMDLREWVAMDTYEFERITYASGIFFPDPCAFHVRSFYEEEL